MHSTFLLVLVVAAAITFDFTNGFHDTANVVAAVISTRVLSPRLAVLLSAILNFAGAFISLKVAATVATGIVDAAQVTERVAFCGLLAAIAWNLVTWALGLPSSSSHALIGGVMGALLAETGSGAIRSHGLLTKFVEPAVLAPIVSFVIAGVTIMGLYRILARRRPGPVRRWLRSGQLLASGLLAVAHGTNDAQKTMGVIALALVAHGDLRARALHVPAWVVVLAAAAIAAGTYAGGWRIIRTLGTRIIKLDVAQGVAAQGASAIVVLLSSHLGYPLSSTQVVSGGIVGAGAGRSLSAVRWGIAGNIVLAWVLTLPTAALLGALFTWISGWFGAAQTGPALLGALAVAAIGWITLRRRARLAAILQPAG